MKKTIIILIIIAVVIGVGIYIYSLMKRPAETAQPGNVNNQTQEQPKETNKTNETQNPAEGKSVVIGKSVEGRDITAYHYGTGDTEILFIGGVHGGYEWNSVLVAYKLMDYLAANPNVIPKNIKVTVIPVLNPDGLNKVVGTTTSFLPTAVSSSNDVLVSGRFNANGVDLNRNFDCNWQAKGLWQNKSVSGGSKAFSEPESQALKNYIEAHNPAAVIAWFSAAGGVFGSNCDNGLLPETRTIMNTYATASGYKAYDSFDFYEITGDMTNWLAKKNIPAISVMLTTHEDIEWSKNQAGVEALLKYYAK